MECKFVVRQKVVCVADLAARVIAYCPKFPYPIKGEVYTVSAIEASPGGVYITLAEFGLGVCACRMIRTENWWFHEHFKPLEHSGMSLLRKIAENPPPLPEDDGEPVKKREVEKV
jgi:hypothetical protein